MKPEDALTDKELSLSDQAIDWIVKIKSGEATDQDREAFSLWRRQNLEHEMAAHEAEEIWYGVGLAGGQLQDDEKKKARARLTRRAVLSGLVLAPAGAMLHNPNLIDDYWRADYRTAVGQKRSVTLPDGSVVHLNAKSAISFDFTDAERSLTLLYGEATFTVARDVERPFIVEADGGYTRALGTIFNIDIRTKEVVVTVLEGIVEISKQERSVQAVADRRVRYGQDGIGSKLLEVDARMETSWHRGKLIFNNRPLGDVVADIERYRSGRIVIANPALRDLEVTGIFDLKDPNSILTTINHTMPVTITRLPFVTVIF